MAPTSAAMQQRLTALMSGEVRGFDDSENAVFNFVHKIAQEMRQCIAAATAYHAELHAAVEARTARSRQRKHHAKMARLLRDFYLDVCAAVGMLLEAALERPNATDPAFLLATLILAQQLRGRSSDNTWADGVALWKAFSAKYLAACLSST